MVQEIDFKQLQDILSSEKAEIVDVRESDELDTGMLDGGKHWPLSTFGLRQREISKSRPTIFYCRSGIRSMKAAEIAESWTSQNVYSLHGGWINNEAEIKSFNDNNCCKDDENKQDSE